jgi:hypothetical protein
VPCGFSATATSIVVDLSNPSSSKLLQVSTLEARGFSCVTRGQGVVSNGLSPVASSLQSSTLQGSYRAHNQHQLTTLPGLFTTGDQRPSSARMGALRLGVVEYQKAPPGIIRLCVHMGYGRGYASCGYRRCGRRNGLTVRGAG